MKRNCTIVYAQALLITAFLTLIPLHVSLHAAEYKIIKDMDDRRIEVPVDPKRIVSMHGVSSERIMILGKGNWMSYSFTKPTPWALRLYPEIKNTKIVPESFSSNIEEMMIQKIDLLLYSPMPIDTKKFQAVGIRAACAFSPRKRPRTLNGFLYDFNRQMRFFGDLLGPEAKTRSERYCRYFDKKVGQILSRTSRIARKDWPTVYYGGRGGNLLSSQGMASVMHWETEVSGGNYLPRAINENFIEVNAEQLHVWNPDIILISGWHNKLDSVTRNPKWANLKAVKNGKVYAIPTGVFAWEYASGESILLVIYMAKIFHPNLFRDWDMKKEMKTFYAEVYGKTISDREAERIILNLPPL